MIASDFIAQVRDAGGQITADGADLVLSALRPLPPDLLDQLKAHKPAILAALAHSDPLPPLWGRIAITEPSGRTIEVDAPSGWILPDWQAYAERYHGPGCAVMAVLPLPQPRAPVDLDEALTISCDGVAGITPALFRALMSPEDIKDIAAGAVHSKTLRAYARSFAEGIRSGRVVVLPGRSPS